jgi:hypothetical protein
MKSAEHYLMRWRDNEFELHELIELAQKEAYNQALDDAVETASCEYKKDYLTGEIDKESILKLKK